MSKIKIILLIVAVAGLPLSAGAQGNATNSPYSRYAYGMLSDHSIAGGHAMGGIGYGLQVPGQINTLNPASYAAVDSLTFLFDLGVDFKMSRMKENGVKQKDYNGNIKNVNLLFPIGKQFAFSAGFMPVSAVGYEYGESDGSKQYSGSGGLLHAYGGLAYNYKNFSVGANVGYLFGSIEHHAYSPIRDNAYTDTITIRPHDLIYTFGVQQKVSLNEKQFLILGAAYSPKINTTAKGTETRWNGGENTKNKSISDYEWAQSIGLGASFQTQNKWLFGADVQWENWKNAKFGGVANMLNDRWRYGAGLEYTPEFRSRSFFKRTKYRMGGYYTNSYITTDKGVKYDEVGVSAGLALPVHNRSTLHLSFDYVNVLPSMAGKLSENYFKFTLNYTFNETWFYKLRIQ
ncbi:MAG: hypothetical protein LBL79_11555 [Prevotella sp.]|jgi:hypothetical protein|nr:hypothetical protein [Prevotella sp.]